jgi:hypothetical protein
LKPVLKYKYLYSLTRERKSELTLEMALILVAPKENRY